MPGFKPIVDGYMERVSGIEEYCERCLRTERWGGSVLLMVIDAAFTSIGLNYFTSVVPKVNEFAGRFVETGRIRNLRELAEAETEELRQTWKNTRSWSVAKQISSYLSGLGDDRTALREWAAHSSLQNWRDDPIGRIKGVGMVTYQYLRMMGGVDTVMPDKIVKRVVNEILEKAGQDAISDNVAFVEKAEEIAWSSGYRAAALCWMTWLIQPEGKKMRIEKYSPRSDVLRRSCECPTRRG